MSGSTAESRDDRGTGDGVVDTSYVRVEADDNVDTFDEERVFDGIPTQRDVAALYDEHHGAMRRVASRFFDGKRPQDADDAVMAVVVRLMEMKADGRLIEQGEHWRPYLLRAAHNACVSITRRDSPLVPPEPDGTPREPITDWDPLGNGFVDQAQHQELLAKLQRALSTLTDKQRSIIRHKIWDNWTNERIGRTLGVSGQAVSQQYKTALGHLRKEVERNE